VFSFLSEALVSDGDGDDEEDIQSFINFLVAAELSPLAKSLEMHIRPPGCAQPIIA